ncbi:MAG: PP2C family protein-serine/threonine phosphatase [Microcoleaceae cyanobacterium]
MFINVDSMASSPWKQFTKSLKTRWNSRLSRRLAFWVFVGIVTIESIILVPSVQRREQELLDQLQAITLGKVTWILVTYPGVSGKALVDELAFLQQQNDLILGGTVYQASGELVGAFGNSPTRTPAQLKNRRPRRSGDFYDNVVWSGPQMKTDYTVVLRHDASSVQPELLAYIARIAGLVLIISLFLTLTVWIALDPIVITPIFRLRRDLLVAGEAIYQDQTPPKFYSASFQRRDELGDVISAFKRMFGQITEAVEARKQAESALQESLDELDHELEKGREMQRNFLPRELVQTPGWEIAAFMSPARRVAGDFYDVFELPCNNIGLVIGDVCDKGVSAGLFMGLFRSLIRIFSGQTVLDGVYCVDRKQGDLSEDTEVNVIHANALKAVQLTNEYVAENHGDEGMFATLFFGVLNLETGQLSYINGGHEPLLVVNSKGEIRELLEPTGTAIGMLPNMSFEIQETQLKSGDALLGCTDGVTEARKKCGEFFGRERFLEIVQSPIHSAQALLDTITSKVLAHMGDAEQSDDITLLAIKRD